MGDDSRVESYIFCFETVYNFCTINQFSEILNWIKDYPLGSCFMSEFLFIKWLLQRRICYLEF